VVASSQVKCGRLGARFSGTVPEKADLIARFNFENVRSLGTFFMWLCSNKLIKATFVADKATPVITP
jgi:hypothetical protein